MSRRSRLPTNCINGLEDIIAVSIHLWPTIRQAVDRAEELMDPIMLAKLNRVAIDLATIERKAKDARHNHYNDA